MDSVSLFQCELKQYKSAIKNKLPFSNAVTKKLLDDLQNGIDDYISINDITSFDNVIEQFGQPEDVAEELKNNTDTQVIRKKVSIKKLIVVFVTVAILLIGIGVVKITNDVDVANATLGVVYNVENESDLIMGDLI